jgi:phosphatidylglycerol---prolipoprotein diacylglyceryl transferase
VDLPVKFPFYLRLGDVAIHPHAFFELLAYTLAFLLYSRLRQRHGDPISANMRWWVIAAAATGAALGSHLLGFLEDPRNHWHAALAGKTVVGGLVGGWVAVEWIKRHFAVHTSTGDLFALPLAVGIAIGRVGCFLTGLADQTYGRATSLPWGVDFGDGIRRHPTQLYEILFLLLLALALLRMMALPLRNGDVFKAFMIGYMSWRFVIDFWKEDMRFFGLSAIQWAGLVVLLVYARDAARVMRALAGRPDGRAFRSQGKVAGNGL